MDTTHTEQLNHLLASIDRWARPTVDASNYAAADQRSRQIGHALFTLATVTRASQVAYASGSRRPFLVQA